MMRFYQRQHQFYCGIDLHARTMCVCIVDAAGKVLVNDDGACNPERFLRLIEPYRQDLVVACECTFHWYWLADLCAEQQIPFVLGHALYMKAIHGGKKKNDKIDAHKIALLLKGGMLPQAYAYPRGMRETRDLLRRRTYLVRRRAELLTHIENTNSQYNLPPFGKKLSYKANRSGVAERFSDECVRQSISIDLELVEHYDRLIRELELYLVRHAKVDDAYRFHLLRSVPGIGKVLALVLLYEMHRVERFESAGEFLSYARLVAGRGSSAGKPKGVMGRKIGNAHLKWAFSEAICFFIRESPEAKRFVARQEQKHGKARARAILAARLGRAVFLMLKRKQPFDVQRFFAS
jgi:transposase